MTAEGVFTFFYPSFTSYIRKRESRQKKATANKPPHQPRTGRADIGQGTKIEEMKRRGEKYF